MGAAKTCIILAGLMLTVSSSPAISFTEEPPRSHNLSCTESQTPCGTGCCPFVEAVCCLDGYQCCESRKVCIPYIGICIGPGSENTVVSTRASPVGAIGQVCPSGSTACGNLCCVLSDATCCEDGLHCCPRGYRCDIPRKQCLRNFTQFSVFDNDKDRNIEPINEKIPAVDETAKPVPNARYKSCPEGALQCPKSRSCCVDDDGNWKCCPKSSSSVALKDTCCETFWGHHCCPDHHLCTIFGCI